MMEIQEFLYLINNVLDIKLHLTPILISIKYNIKYTVFGNYDWLWKMVNYLLLTGKSRPPNCFLPILVYSTVPCSLVQEKCRFFYDYDINICTLFKNHYLNIILSSIIVIYFNLLWNTKDTIESVVEKIAQIKFIRVLNHLTISL